MGEEKYEGFTLSSEVANDLIQKADSYLDEIGERLLKSQEPIWLHQAELGRALIQLSAGGLIFSFTVIQFAADKIFNPSLPWLIPLTWVCWTICLAIGLVREGRMSGVRSYVALMENERGNIRQKILAKVGSELKGDDLENIFQNAANKVDNPVSAAINIHYTLTGILFSFFFLGMVSLVVFGILNLPF